MSTVELDHEKFELIGTGALDERNRLALTRAVEALRGRFGNVGKVHFMIYSNKAGLILLLPQTTVPLHEAWLLNNKAALASVLAGIEEAGLGKVRELGSFAEYVADDTE